MGVIGADVSERIRFYRFRSLSLVATILAPLICGNILSLTMFFVAIAQGRSWMFSELADFGRPVAVLAAAGIPAHAVAFTAWRARARTRRNLKDIYRETRYDQAAYNSFREALASVSMGLGMAVPLLEVLGIPTANSTGHHRGQAGRRS